MTVRLGMFTMPFHHPARDYADFLEEDQEAIILADRLGFSEAFVGVSGQDWDQPKLWRRSMELLATEVMPRFARHADATPAR